MLKKFLVLVSPATDFTKLYSCNKGLLAREPGSQKPISEVNPTFSKFFSNYYKQGYNKQGSKSGN